MVLIKSFLQQNRFDSVFIWQLLARRQGLKFWMRNLRQGAIYKLPDTSRAQSFQKGNFNSHVNIIEGRLLSLSRQL